MSITNNGGVRVTAPDCEPSLYGLLSAVEVEDRTDTAWERGFSVEYPTCAAIFAETPCPTIAMPRKNVENAVPDVEDSDPFTMVGAYKCATVGRPVEDAWDYAEQRLNRNEERMLERAFWTGADVAGNEIRQSLGGASVGATDITPAAGPVSITDGFALLESYAGNNYPCQPVFHATRGIATYLAERSLVGERDNKLRAKATGSLIVVGGGYGVTGPLGNVPAAGVGWLFATGPLKVLRGATAFVPERGNLAESVDRSINDQTVYAERPYGITFDSCLTAAVRVNLKSCCC